MATERYFLCGSMDFADLKTGEYRHFEAARNSCASAGMVPANGLLYTFPHACGCYSMLRGYLGLVTEDVPKSADELLAGVRLTKGPAFGRRADSHAVNDSHDWPTYRHDAKRSGATTDAGPKKLNELWSAEVAASPPAAWSAEWDQADGGRVSAPVVAEGLALTAAAGQHRLMAFDVETGKQRWSFTAGGRIDCPPTVYNGHCLLGARDGAVYCLRLHDGELAWRFQAAPRDRRIVAYGQLESAWPVVGGVLVYDGLAYFTVGRHAGADGGVFVGALEPDTGKLVWAQRPEDYEGLPDVLNGDRGSVQMASWEFDAKTGKHGAAGDVRLRGGRLGLLNDAWYDRPIAMRKNLQLWTTDEDVEGQLLAFRNGATAAFSACSSVAGSDGKMSGNASLTGRSEAGRAWTVEMPLDVRMHALVLAAERLYAAGLLRDDASSATAEPVVRIYDLADGKLQDEASIPSPPVHDGMIVAGGRLFIVTQSGKLICLGEK